MALLPSPLRQALAAASLALLSSAPYAAPSFSWEFVPALQHLAPTDSYEITGVLTNTGTTHITAITYMESWYGSIGGYISAWNWNLNFWSDYAALDIAPGESFSFHIADVDIVGAASGLYTGVADYAPYQTRIGVVNDAGEYSGQILASNQLLLQVPEPASMPLAALALLGACAAGLRRRRDA